jgi:hypothetical protein
MNASQNQVHVEKEGGPTSVHQNKKNLLKDEMFLFVDGTIDIILFYHFTVIYHSEWNTSNVLN